MPRSFAESVGTTVSFPPRIVMRPLFEAIAYAVGNLQPVIAMAFSPLSSIVSEGRIE